MTKPNKSLITTKIKVWIVLDQDNKIVGAHHGKKYMAELNAHFIENGRVVRGTVLLKLPKCQKRKKAK